jgi:hypothetical protein
MYFSWTSTSTKARQAYRLPEKAYADLVNAGSRSGGGKLGRWGGIGSLHRPSL